MGSVYMLLWGWVCFFSPVYGCGGYSLCAICLYGLVAALVGYLVILCVGDIQRMLRIVAGGTGSFLLACSTHSAMLGVYSFHYDTDC